MYSRHDFIDLWMKSHISNLNPIRHFEHIPFEWLRWGGARIRNFLNQIVQPQLPTMDFQEFQPLRCLGYSPFLHTVRWKGVEKISSYGTCKLCLLYLQVLLHSQVQIPKPEKSQPRQPDIESLERFMEPMSPFNNKTGLEQRLRKKQESNTHVVLHRKKYETLAETLTRTSSLHHLSWVFKKVENQLSFPQLSITWCHGWRAGGFQPSLKKYDRQIGSFPQGSGRKLLQKGKKRSLEPQQQSTNSSQWL